MHFKFYGNVLRFFFIIRVLRIPKKALERFLNFKKSFVFWISSQFKRWLESTTFLRLIMKLNSYPKYAVSYFAYWVLFGIDLEQQWVEIKTTLQFYQIFLWVTVVLFSFFSFDYKKMAWIILKIANVD